jgi:hypothetical protein
MENYFYSKDGMKIEIRRIGSVSFDMATKAEREAVVENYVKLLNQSEGRI